MLLTMVKMEIIGSKKYFYQVLALLHDLGTLHIEDLSKKEDLFLKRMHLDDEASESKKDLRSLLTRINGIISVIEPSDITKSADKSKDYSHFWKKSATELHEDADKLLALLEEKTRSLASKKSQLELELNSLDRYQNVIKRIYPLAKSIVSLKGSETVAFLLEGDYKDTVNVLNKEIGKITNDNHELISTPIDDHTTAAIIVFNKKYSVKMHRFLGNKVSELNLPTDMKDLTIDGVLREIDKKKIDYPKEIEKIQHELGAISKERYFKLKAISNAIQNKVDEIDKVSSFGETEFTFVIHGWLPHKDMPNMKKKMNESFGSKILVRQLEVKTEELEDAPVVMENSAWVKPFEMLLKVVKPPRYGTIDPTLFIAIFFPIFFGFIVGDMGYGLIVFTTATILRYKFKDNPNEMIDSSTRIFQIAGVSAFIFGFMYGEAFGTLLDILVFKKIGGELGKFYHHNHYLAKIGPFKWPYHRDPKIANRITELLTISLGIGLVHLTTSLSMGIVNSIREKSRKHMWEKIGLLMFILALTSYGVLKAKGAPSIITGPLLLTFISGLGLVLYGGGPLALMEHSIGLIANLFSYLRLFALGLAGAILASAANSFVKVLGWEVGILLAVMLHTINVVVHTFSPAIHSIRLNLLEGFGKFYEEGGKEYKPFKARR